MGDIVGWDAAHICALFEARGRLQALFHKAPVDSLAYGCAGLGCCGSNLIRQVAGGGVGGRHWQPLRGGPYGDGREGTFFGLLCHFF